MSARAIGQPNEHSPWLARNEIEFPRNARNDRPTGRPDRISVDVADVQPNTKHKTTKTANTHSHMHTHPTWNAFNMNKCLCSRNHHQHIRCHCAVATSCTHAHTRQIFQHNNGVHVCVRATNPHQPPRTVVVVVDWLVNTATKPSAPHTSPPPQHTSTFQLSELGRPFTGGSWCGAATGPQQYYSETSTVTASVKVSVCVCARESGSVRRCGRIRCKSVLACSRAHAYIVCYPTGLGLALVVPVWSGGPGLNDDHAQ